MALLKLENTYVNLEEIQLYYSQNAEIHFKGGQTELLTETQATIFNWFLSNVKGPTFGIFDATALYEQRDELAARQKAMEEAEAALPEVEAKLEEVKANATSMGKPLTEAQILKAREMLQKAQRTGKLIPINERKN